MGKTSKDKRDIYYRLAKEQGYRARSAFKLLQLDDTFHLLDGVTRVVDLCAAPGGWSQVIVERLQAQQQPHDALNAFTVVAVDLMEMAPLDCVVQLQGDITHERTADAIVARFAGAKAHVVVSDGAPDVLGLHDLDEYLQAQLVLAALNISLQVLEPGGAFVAKLFRGKEHVLLLAQLRRFFARVTVAKPKASRNSSFEAFVVCQGLELPPDFMPSMARSLLDLQYVEDEELEEADWSSHVDATRGVCTDVTFCGAGDVFGLDADQSYPLDVDVVYHAPLQMPINPPYKQALVHAKAE